MYLDNKIHLNFRKIIKKKLIRMVKSSLLKSETKQPAKAQAKTPRKQNRSIQNQKNGLIWLKVDPVLPKKNSNFLSPGIYLHYSVYSNFSKVHAFENL
jgi:hypothetical protein